MLAHYYISQLIVSSGGTVSILVAHCIHYSYILQQILCSLLCTRYLMLLIPHSDVTSTPNTTYY